MEKIDLKKAIDNYCSLCGKKKKKYLGLIMGTPAVLYRETCNCSKPNYGKKIAVTDKELYDKLQTPFWKVLGLKPKPHELELEKRLKWKNMSYGDYRRNQEAGKAQNPSAIKDFEKHISKYGRYNGPSVDFQKTDKKPF